MHSIRFKITAITIAAILTTVLCVLVASYSTLRVENNRSSVEMLNLIGQNTKKSVEKYTESIEESMQTIINIATDSLDSIILADNKGIGSDSELAKRTPEQTAILDDYMTAYCNKVREMFASFATHTHGVITYYYCINPALTVKEHGFFYSRVGKTGFARQEPLDARTLDPEDIEHTTWYYTTIQRGRPSWIGPYTAHFLGELWTCSYVAPIYKSGTLIGVIGMDIPASILIEQISPIHVYKTGFASLLDENGRVLYHPVLEFGSVPDFSNLAINEDVLTGINSGDALIRYKVDGIERQMSFCTLSNGMKLVVVAPVDEINASWLQMTRNNLVITVAILVVFSGILLIVMHFLTLPLLRLTAASQRLADADYDVELNYHGSDEIGTLTSAFIRMKDQQKKYIEDLNRRIYTDVLTGLPNMRYFFQLAEEERKRQVLENRQPVMLYCDLIGMKHFNRQYGFEEGDRLLRSYSICPFFCIL